MAPRQLSQPFKRKRSSEHESVMPPSPSTEMDPPAEQLLPYPPAKRIKVEGDDAAWPQAAFGATFGPHKGADCPASPPSPPPSVSLAMHDAAGIEEVKDVVQYQFCHDILMKHNELRLIEQELAKCQIALEQLRRCHLIPYPTDCPTPEQMLDIASGRGLAVRPRPGATVPKWSAPFGVVDGPYARHYAKWLIPDPVFDGPLPNWPGLTPPSRVKGAVTADARATRNSITDSSKGRPTRGLTGQKLQSLSSGYPQPKDKAGPCVLKRSDGKVVKLVCIDCHRENFSSTQGFINHCRIAHKRDFKSHEEAAVHCGHPIEVDRSAPPTAASKNNAAPAPAVGAAIANPELPDSKATLARISSITATVAPLLGTGLSAAAAPSSVALGQVSALARNDSETVNTLLQRIESSYKQYSSTSGQGPSSSASGSVKNEKRPASSFIKSGEAPFLSRFLEKKQFSGNLAASVEDAKEVTDFNDAAWYADNGYDYDLDSPQVEMPSGATVKRAPSRSTQALGFANFDGSVDGAETSRPGSSKSVSTPAHLSFGSQETTSASIAFVKTGALRGAAAMYVDDEMDVDLSPIPSTSNNAPSLVSDDGEYDDSDDGSDSDTSDTDLGSVSDVAEINIDEDENETHDTPQPLRHHRGSVKLKKDEAKHVAFASPVKGSNNGRRN